MQRTKSKDDPRTLCDCGRPATGIDAETRSPSCRQCAESSLTTADAPPASDQLVADGGEVPDRDLDPITPEAALEYYFENTNLSEYTLVSHENRIQSFVDWLKSEESYDGEVVNMNNVDPLTVHHYLVWLRDEGSCHERTCRNNLMTISAFVDELSEIDAVPESLADRISGLVVTV